MLLCVREFAIKMAEFINSGLLIGNLGFPLCYLVRIMKFYGVLVRDFV